jgi:hypothetical protein
MLRRLVVFLIVANLLFFVWSRGWLEEITGSRVHPEREPERLTRQVNPGLVVILPPGAASATSAAPAPEGSAAATAMPSAAASSVFAAGTCLEAGPFATGAAVSAVAALQALQPPLPPGSWAEVKTERPGSWMVYMGRFPNRDALLKKDEELKRTRVNYESLTAPAELVPGFSFGRHDDRAAADRALEQLGQRGVRSARVVELTAPASQHMLRVEKADAALAAQLTALRSPVLGRGFVPCGS